MEKNSWIDKQVIFLTILSCILMLLLSVAACFGGTVDMDIIKDIESSGDPNAVSFLGEKYGIGLYQVSSLCLKDYNHYNKKDYSLDDLYDPYINETIANWYMNRRLPQLLKYYDKADTVENRIRSYNAGVGGMEKANNYVSKYVNRGGRL